MKSLKHWATFAVVTASLLVGSASYGWSQTKVKVGITKSASDVIFIIAMDKGYFKKQNLDVELIAFKSAVEMVAPLGSGSLDVGGGAPGVSLYNLTARNVELRIVADKGSQRTGHGYFPLIVRKDLIDSGRFKSLSDLRGLKLAYNGQGSSGDAIFARLMSRAGLKITDTDRVYLGIPELGVAMQNGAIDVAFAAEPSASIMVRRNIGVRYANGDEIYPDQQLAVLLYGPTMLKQRDVGNKFMIAYVQAVRDYNDALTNGKLIGAAADAIVDMLVSNTEIKDASIWREIVTPGVDPNGAVNVESLSSDLEMFKQQGLVKGAGSISAIVDLEFGRNAVSTLGAYQKKAGGTK